MAAFNNRNSEPLEEDSPIDGLGSSKRDALFVVVPSSLDSEEGRFLVISKDNHTYDHYMSVGKGLKDSSIVQDLVARIKEIQESKPSDIHQIPFLFIDGSSGLGKTQAAFSLMAAGIDVRFIPSDKVVDQSQSIYKCFQSYSDLFLDCVSKDMDEINATTLPFTCRVYGFILALLSEDQFYKGAATRTVVETALSNLNKKPVIFLDEFPIVLKSRNNETDLGRLRFMRNVFRSFKLVVIVSSTNSSAVNMVNSSTNSRKDIGLDAYNVLWCYMVPFCSSYQMCTCHSLEVKNDFILALLKHSRPLFSSLAVKFCRHNEVNEVDGNNMVDFLNAMTAYIATEVKASKQADAASGGNYFLFGQLQLFLSASYMNGYTQEDDKNLLIHRHFANLTEKNVFPIFLNARGLVTENGDVWTVRVAFPPLQDDFLLYLSLMGGVGNHAIEGEDKKRISFATGLSQMEKALTSRANYANSNQRSNDGMRLEALLAGSVVLASHANGFAGIELSNLLEELCYEISFTEQVCKLVGIPKEAQNLLKTVIPYLAPPNQRLPEYLSCMGNVIQMGECQRLANGHQCDLSACNGFLTGECKDWSKALDRETVEKILDRIPQTSSVHLVLTNKIQKGYYGDRRQGTNRNSKRSYDQFIRDDQYRLDRLRNCHVFELFKTKDNAISLKKIDGLSLPPDSSSSNANEDETVRQTERLVIFIPLSQV